MTRKSFLAAAALVVLLGLTEGCGAPQSSISPPPADVASTRTVAAPAASPEETDAITVPSAAPAIAAASAAKPAVTVTVPVKPTSSTAPETEPETEDAAALTCTLWVRCDTVLDNMDKLDEEKAELIPADGVLLHAEEIPFDEGESVFDVLLRETREEKVHLEFVDTPVFNSAYIEGIGNLYELDCGELSGWSYKVNGVFPGYGCSQYTLAGGDVVEWVYTCDLGRDVGGTNGWGD